jgi:hypothetical protein
LDLIEPPPACFLGPCHLLDDKSRIYPSVGILDMYNLTSFPPVLVTLPGCGDDWVFIWCYLSSRTLARILETSNR